MQEVWGSTPHSSTAGQSRNLEHLIRPLQRPYSSKVPEPGTAGILWPRNLALARRNGRSRDPHNGQSLRTDQLPILTWHNMLLLLHAAPATLPSARPCEPASARCSVRVPLPPSQRVNLCATCGSACDSQYGELRQDGVGSARGRHIADSGPLGDTPSAPLAARGLSNTAFGPKPPGSRNDRPGDAALTADVVRPLHGPWRHRRQTHVADRTDLRTAPLPAHSYVGEYQGLAHATIGGVVSQPTTRRGRPALAEQAAAARPRQSPPATALSHPVAARVRLPCSAAGTATFLLNGAGY